jgi:hypothetical protein
VVFSRYFGFTDPHDIAKITLVVIGTDESNYHMITTVLFFLRCIKIKNKESEINIYTLLRNNFTEASKINYIQVVFSRYFGFTDPHDIAKILLKVVLNTITLTHKKIEKIPYFMKNICRRPIIDNPWLITLQYSPLITHGLLTM